MKTAQNPNKTAKIKPFAPVVVLVITHLPDMQSEYHRGRFEVIHKSLVTLGENVGLEYSMIVWDNGSCRDMVDFLRHSGYGGDTVILSRNIGKTNALKSVMRMLPPGTILAYGDDDIEYFPNWLEPQIKILRTFPNVGTVTGYPSRLESRWGTETARLWESFQGHKDGEVFEHGRFIPDEWERDYCESHGRNWGTHLINTKNDLDTRITYKGVQAYALGHHCQFVCYPERVEPLIPWTDDAMAAEIPFDKAVDAAGLLRLATAERLTRHIGNVLEKGE